MSFSPENIDKNIKEIVSENEPWFAYPVKRMINAILQKERLDDILNIPLNQTNISRLPLFNEKWFQDAIKDDSHSRASFAVSVRYTVQVIKKISQNIGEEPMEIDEIVIT